MNPDHYSRLDPQPIELIEKWGLGFHLANAFKYLARAPHKGEEIRDLRKAIWYIERYMQVVEAKQKQAPIPPPAEQV